MLLELDEDGPLQDPAKPVQVGIESGRHGRLAVTNRERGELAQDDIVRHAERCDGADRGDAYRHRAAARPELLDDVVHLSRERDLSRVQRVHTAALRCRIVHAGVVDVREQNSEPDYELLPDRPATAAAGGPQPFRRGPTTRAATSRAWTIP
jgi:hypothetical protein